MKSIFKVLFRIILSTGVMAVCAFVVIAMFINANLPSVENLEDSKLQVPLRIYTHDHKLIGEYGEKRRTPIKIEDVPEKLKLAILATEDRRFYDHHGVDFRGLMRASLHMLLRGNKEQGASTITMQVARNFYLSRKKTFTRKLSEILLAVKIEKEFDKDKILELYLNKIYFGKRAYGVQAAAQVYYGVPVDQLDLAQMAMIAGLPQAPSAINPLNNPKAALKRRTHVLNRMKHYGFITEKEYKKAVSQPIAARYHGPRIEAYAPYAAEMARAWMVEQHGLKVYTDGYEVHTTIDSTLQKYGDTALTKGLLAYDKRHGYRGPAGTVQLPVDLATADWDSMLKEYPKLHTLVPAVVTEVGENSIKAYLAHGQAIEVKFSSMTWAQPQLKSYYLGAVPKKPSDVAKRADVIYVEAGNHEWLFSQVPQVSGSLVALNPYNGAIVSMTGGFDFNLSNFNRVTQALRQPGSNFKPFVYAAALEDNYTAASTINDAPIVFQDSTLEGVWRPQNDTRKFYGPTRLRVALAHSRNLVTIRLLQSLGISRAKGIIEKFGFERRALPNGLSMALGTMSTSPLSVATGYAAFANGGYKVSPFLIEKVVDYSGNTIFEATPLTACRTCHLLSAKPTPTEEAATLPEEAPQDMAAFEVEVTEPEPEVVVEEQPVDKTVYADQIISPQTAYIMYSMLKDVIQVGTATDAKKLERTDLAGKTGTTNQQMDAWFTGFNPNLVCSVWVGFDEPKSLKEYSRQAALPIWMNFMGPALRSKPNADMPEPAGIVRLKIDPHSGMLARPGSNSAIYEIFRENAAPSEVSPEASDHSAVTIAPSSNSDAESLF